MNQILEEKNQVKAEKSPFQVRHELYSDEKEMAYLQELLGYLALEKKGPVASELEKWKLHQGLSPRSALSVNNAGLYTDFT